MIPSCHPEQLRVWTKDESTNSIAKEFGCSHLLATLLQMRGIEPTETARKTWLTPDLDVWLNALDLGQDCDKAARIWNSLAPGSSVVVYGDYDVDGIASTTFMMELALLKKARVRYYIPHRYNQGYGFHPSVVDSIAKSKSKCDLLVVVDCGTQNRETAELAREHGIPVLIFDHHLARGDVARSDALVNPQIDGNDLAKRLCAAGVVWCWAWKKEVANLEWLMQRIDLASLATIADCVPMSSPLNRAIVRKGIEAMKRHPRKGLYALMKAMDLELDSLDSDSLAMRIIPCLNAAGRLELADLAMNIFFPSIDVAPHVEKLIALNKKRRDMSAKIIADIESGQEDSNYDHVLFGEDWSAGVLSSVASQVCTMKDAPVVLCAPAQPPLIRGTLRVPEGVDAEAILGFISADLLSWGGHRMAAGFSVTREKWDYVREKLEEILRSTEVVSEKEDVLSWNPAELHLESWKDVERIGPFGVGNPYPLFFSPHEGDIHYEKLGKKGNHIKIFVDGCPLLGFRGEHIVSSDTLPTGWIYKPRTNVWRSVENLQLVLEKIVTDAA